MAPPEQTFPVSELEARVRYKTTKYKEKSRKLPNDFDLKKDCELLELVQYSCTTIEQQNEQIARDPNSFKGTECFPFVRLFRRCGHGKDTFHVETTAWEGEHAWKPSHQKARHITGYTSQMDEQSFFANYSGYFWSKK